MEDDIKKRHCMVDHANKQTESVGYSSYDVWLKHVKRHSPVSADAASVEDEPEQNHKDS